jgi:hypothetical protein
LPKDALEREKHAPKAAAKYEDRQAVSTAVTERMHQLGLTAAVDGKVDVVIASQHASSGDVRRV